MEIHNRDLGFVSYKEALQQQSAELPKSEACVFYFESEPVITLGRRAMPEVASVETLRVDRGGLATYHGPGQIVFFPSLHLPSWGFSVRGWVETLAQTAIMTLAEWDIPSFYDEKNPGVFTDRGKIASIGLRIQTGWSRHGLALNVNGDFAAFQEIRACGICNARVDQMSSWTAASRLALPRVAERWASNLAKSLVDHRKD